MDVLWIFLPILGAYLAHAPVLKYNLCASLARPIDGGAAFRGRRIFGDNKTWRGFLVMLAGVSGLALILSLIPSYWTKLPHEIQSAGRWTFALLLGWGFELAEFPNSFLKRQFDIKPGERKRSLTGAFFVILDQGDIVIGIWIFLLPIWTIPLSKAALAFGVVVSAHLVINVIGYLIGARKSWI